MRQRLMFVALCLIWAASFGTAHAACPGNTQMEMNQCAGAKFQAAERRMNNAYQRIEASADLAKTQTAFIAYRDAQCGFEAQRFAGGSMQPMIVAGCLYDLTNARAIRLEQIAKEQ